MTAALHSSNPILSQSLALTRGQRTAGTWPRLIVEGGVVDQFISDMRIAKYSPATIKSRVEAIERLRLFLADTPLIQATPDELRAYQDSYAHNAPATVDVYTRHVQAFFQWAARRGFVPADPTLGMTRTRVRKGKPHPVSFDDLRVIFAATSGFLRTVYILATFAGLRRGEICRLEARDIYDLRGDTPRALVHGKGGKDRTVPLIEPVAAELRSAPRRGFVVTDAGRPLQPERLSIQSHYHLHGLGFETTLHSMRHTFATESVRITKDLLLVRDLLGHESVATTEIYAESDVTRAHAQLAELGTAARQVLAGRRLHAVN